MNVPQIGNWGRWGANDERGTLNLIGAGEVREAAQAVKTGKVYQLGLPVQRDGIPLSPYRGAPQRLTLVNRDDEWMARAYGGEEGVGFNEDVLVVPAHTSTHMDSLGHVYAGNKMYNDFSNELVRPYSGAGRCSIDKIGGVAGRGVLVDVAAAKGVSALEEGYVITVEDLEETISRQGVDIRSGDCVLIRTGWVEEFLRESKENGGPNPGIGIAAAKWLAARDVAIVGSDNMAVEVIPFDEDVFLGVHMVLLVEHGIHLLENMLLESLSADRCYEFLFVVAPLRVTGATGSPVTPLAIG